MLNSRGRQFQYPETPGHLGADTVPAQPDFCFADNNSWWPVMDIMLVTGMPGKRMVSLSRKGISSEQRDSQGLKKRGIGQFYCGVQVLCTLKL